MDLNEHLNKARKKAHETQRKNGHYIKMGQKSAYLSMKKSKKPSTDAS